MNIIDPFGFLKHKLRHVTISFLIAGIIFAALGIGIIFIPTIIQYLFVIGFVIIGLTFLTVAIKLSHLGHILGGFELPNVQRKRRKS
jgi:hypothetical protein